MEADEKHREGERELKVRRMELVRCAWNHVADEEGEREERAYGDLCAEGIS
jgi:hypothetical protein